MDMNLEEQIRRRAYHIWEYEGRPHGRDCDHWHQATRELVNDAPVSNEAMAADEAIVSVVHHRAEKGGRVTSCPRHEGQRLQDSGSPKGATPQHAP